MRAFKYFVGFVRFGAIDGSEGKTKDDLGLL